MTYEEKIQIVKDLEAKHNLDNNDRVKTVFLTDALLAMGFGRNASTLRTLLFVHDLMASEIPVSTPEEAEVNRLMLGMDDADDTKVH
jgi:hypothetical protein